MLREEEAGEPSPQGDLFTEKQEPKADDRLDRIEKGLKDTQAALTQFFQPRQRPQPQPNPDARKQIEEQFYANPMGMTAQMAQHIAAQQVAQVKGEFLPTQMKLARQEARDSDPEIFDKYKADIESWVQQTYPNPEHQALPFVWEQGLNRVKATKLDDIAAYKAERKKAAAAAAAPSRRGYAAEESDVLNSDQQLAARIFGLSEDQYKKASQNYRKDLTSPYEGRDMLNSEAANHLTFDSRKPRQRKTA